MLKRRRVVRWYARLTRLINRMSALMVSRTRRDLLLKVIFLVGIRLLRCELVLLSYKSAWLLCSKLV